EITRRAVRCRRFADAAAARHRRCSLVTAHQSNQELLAEPRRHHKKRDSEQRSYDQRALHPEKAHERGQRLERDTPTSATTAAGTGTAIFEVAGSTTTFDTHAASYLDAAAGRLAWDPPWRLRSPRMGWCVNATRTRGPRARRHRTRLALKAVCAQPAT